MRMFTTLRLSALLILMLLSFSAFSSIDVRVDGLFKDRAVLTINGKTRFLKVNESSPEGVRLLSSDSRQAVLEVAGTIRKMGVSERISSNFVPAEVTEIRIPKGEGGHYFVGGFINGRAVDFMVDTGASMIAMSEARARLLNIDLRNAEQGAASTANGVVGASVVNLEKVVVGNITVHQVQVSVLAGNFPTQILLGNSFLSRVEMSEANGVMVLRSKY